MTPETAQTKTHAAEVLIETLAEIGWKEVIQPELEKFKHDLSGLLVNSVLGKTIAYQTDAGPAIVTKEQLAGEIKGLLFIEDLFARILREGMQAEKYLQTIGDKYQIQ